MNRYRRGRRYEYRTMSWLESEGYDCTRSAGSHGTWDVIAIRSDHVRLIQVKCGSAKVTPMEREQIKLFAVPASVTREIWTWGDRVRHPKVEVI